mgnify:CR=1 FL=1
MAQRNHPCDDIVVACFPTEPGHFEKVGKEAFQRQLHHCMLGQALQMKSTIEERRSRNELGHLVWQLNEIWPTGGWGSLEHGNPMFPGQVLGGRWKPLHCFYRASTFADVLATCNGEGVGFIRNDAGGREFRGDAILNVINIETGRTDDGQVYKDIYLPQGPGSVKTFPCPKVDGSTQFMSIDVLSSDGTLESRNSPLLFKPPKEISCVRCDSGLDLMIGGGESDGVVTIEITTTAPVALFVVLTTAAHGRFSDNAFPTFGGWAVVEFHPFGELDLDLLRETLRVEDMAMCHHGHCKTVESA